MRVAHRRVGEQHALLRQHPLREALGPELIELLLRAGRRRQRSAPSAARGSWNCAGPRAVLHFRIAVDDDLADERQDARGAIALARPAEQLRRLVDEARRVVALREARMRDDLIEEAQVGDDAADAELPQRAMHARDGLLRRRRPRRDLHQQRIVRARDDRAAVGGARIQPDAEARRAAIRGDRAVVRNEVVLRILGRDAALQRVRADADVLPAAARRSRACRCARRRRCGSAPSPGRCPSRIR